MLQQGFLTLVLLTFGLDTSVVEAHIVHQRVCGSAPRLYLLILLPSIPHHSYSDIKCHVCREAMLPQLRTTVLQNHGVGGCGICVLHCTLISALFSNSCHRLLRFKISRPLYFSWMLYNEKKLFLQAKCINSVDNPFLVNSEQLIYNFRQDCCKYFTEN